MGADEDAGATSDAFEDTGERVAVDRSAPVCDQAAVRAGVVELVGDPAQQRGDEAGRSWRPRPFRLAERHAQPVTVADQHDAVGG